MELLSVFNYNLQNRISFNKYLESKMEISFLELKKMMKNSSCSPTADGWKSSSNTSFIGITARIVTAEFQSCNIWAFLKPIYSSTSENIEKSFTCFKERFDLGEVNTITIDEAPNMCKAAANFLKKEGQRCCAHSSKFKLYLGQLAINHVLNSSKHNKLTKVTDTFNGLIHTLRTTSSINNIELNLDVQMIIRDYNSTRWSSPQQEYWKVKMYY